MSGHNTPPENDTISRQEIIRRLNRAIEHGAASLNGEHPVTAEGIKEMVINLPSVRPEIIRCGDCDWWTRHEGGLQGRCELMGIYPTRAWFCANAKRRRDDFKTGSDRPC